MGTLFHAEWFTVPFIEWIHSVSYMRFYLNRGGVPPFPVVLCSLSHFASHLFMLILNGTLNVLYVYESELVALLCCRDIHTVNTNRGRGTLTTRHLCLQRWRPRGLILAIWDEHTLFFSLAWTRKCPLSMNDTFIQLILWLLSFEMARSAIMSLEWDCRRKFCRGSLHQSLNTSPRYSGKNVPLQTSFGSL